MLQQSLEENAFLQQDHLHINWEKIYQKIVGLLSATSPLHLDAKQSLMNIFMIISVELKNHAPIDQNY